MENNLFATFRYQNQVESLERILKFHNNLSVIDKTPYLLIPVIIIALLYKNLLGDEFLITINKK